MFWNKNFNLTKLKQIGCFLVQVCTHDKAKTIADVNGILVSKRLDVVIKIYSRAQFS